MGKKYDLSSLSLLVIDNSNYMLSILKILLKGFGIQHLSDSNNAEEAFGLARSMPIDIIIVDHTRTGTDGIAFIKQVRSAEDSSNPYVPIIMLTAHSERTIVEQARDAGVTELLRKPITAAGLFSRILETVERPRPFIRSKTYFGPDRRRRVAENYTGEERRKDNLDAALKIDDEAETAPAAS